MKENERTPMIWVLAATTILWVVFVAVLFAGLAFTEPIADSIRPIHSANEWFGHNGRNYIEAALSACVATLGLGLVIGMIFDYKTKISHETAEKVCYRCWAIGLCGFLVALALSPLSLERWVKETILPQVVEQEVTYEAKDLPNRPSVVRISFVVHDSVPCEVDVHRSWVGEQRVCRVFIYEPTGSLLGFDTSDRH